MKVDIDMIEENRDKLEAIDRLIEVLNSVREGCPWDREQTVESLKMLTVEECYELVDVVTSGNWDGICEELGDILMHIIFYSKIAEEQGRFTLADVANYVSDKLVYRHPHVFSDTVVNSTDDVLTNWEKLKKRKKREGGVLSGVPSALPALIKAYRMQSKAANIGFDWEHKEDVWDKVTEEIAEVHEAAANGDKEHLEEEFGDLLFAVINAARKYGVDAECALERCNRKFKSRFESVEGACRDAGIEIEDTPLEKLEEFWQKAKKVIRCNN